MYITLSTKKVHMISGIITSTILLCYLEIKIQIIFLVRSFDFYAFRKSNGKGLEKRSIYTPNT